MYTSGDGIFEPGAYDIDAFIADVSDALWLLEREELVVYQKDA